MPKPRFVYLDLYHNTQIYLAYQNLDLYRIPKPRFMQYSKTQIYLIPKPRFISHTKTYIQINIKTQIYTAYQNLYLFRIPKPRFIQYSIPRFIYIPRHSIYSMPIPISYITYQNLDLLYQNISHNKTQIYTVYQYLDLYHRTKPRFISYTKTQIYIVCQNLD